MENIIQKIRNQRLGILFLIFLASASLQAQIYPTPGFTLPAGKQICITYEVMVNANVCPTGTVPGGDISNQSQVQGSNFTTVSTDDPDIGGSPGPTLTPISTLTIGNLVYDDINRDGDYDIGTDAVINGVVMNLYVDNGDDVLSIADGAPITSTTTAGGGLYSFSVCPGDYIVEVAASNFAMGGALYNAGAPYVSSPLSAASDPDFSNIDNDDNGDPISGFGVASQAFTMAYGTEPDGADMNTNNRVDFGFKTPTTVTINDVTVLENTGGGTTNFNFTIIRNDNSEAFSLTVNTADGTAASPSDFTAISGAPLSFFAGGSFTQNVTVLVNRDNIVEANETFTVILSGAPSFINITDGSGLGTINNDDNATITLTGPNPVPPAEGNAGTTSYIFTATLSNPVQGGVNVAYTTNNGTATTGDNDYADNDGTLNFSGNTAGETQMITVLVNGDTKVEPDETFMVALGAITGAPIAGSVTLGAPSAQTGTIVNDDNATVTLSGPSPVPPAEGNVGTTAYIFTATLDNAVQGGFNLFYSTSDGTATTADNDYVDNDSPPNAPLMFNGTAGQALTITVLVNGDTKVENNETFMVSLGSVSGAFPGASITTAGSPQTGTIVNDDNAVITLTGSTSVAEGNSGQTPVVFTATLNNPVQGAFTVAYNTIDGTATIADNDYMDNDGTLMFSGIAGQALPITVQVNGDLNIEADETFTVTLGAVTGAPAGVTTAGSPQTGTINNDEQDWGDAPSAAQSGFAGTYPTLSADNGARHAIAPGGLRLGATIDGDLDGQPNATATGDGADEDGVTLPAALITGTTANITVNASGAGNLQGWVDFNRDGDWTDPGEQVFTNQAVVAGSNPLSFPVPGGASVGTSFARFRLATATGIGIVGAAADGEVEDYQVSILNNQFTVDNPSVIEGNAGTATLTFTISRTTNSSASSVDYTVSAGTATLGTDYVSNPSGTINFTMGGPLFETVMVTVNGDLIVEDDETILLTLSNPVNGGISVSSGTGSITDDDNATLTLSGGIAQNEGNAGTTPYVFTVTLNNEVQGGFNVPYTTNDGTATVADLDYVDNDGPALVFAGTAGESHTITVLVNGDTKVEANETFTVALGTLTGTSAVQVAAITPAGSPQQGTINNDDNAIVTLTGTIAQNEGNAGTTPFTFTATLNNAVQGGFTVAYNTNDGTATVADLDYVDNDGPALVFAGTAGESHTITVLVNGDIKVEANETFTVTLGAVGATTLGASITTAGSPQTGTITNDDNATVTLTPMGGVTQNEGNTGTTPFVFTATLNNPVQGGFSLPYTTNNGTATVADLDYVDNDGTLMFNGTAGETYPITVLVNGDSKVEANETFTVTLGAISGAPAGVTTAGSPQTGTINNDEVDWGDGPDTLPTVLVYNGARHNTVLGFHLGATVDGDPDGQPSLLANGDDTDADGDDEDGVILPGVFVTGLMATITVNASQAGKLDAFMDFNWNRDLADAGEKIFDNVALVAGDNVLTFMVPSNAVVGSSFLRFRFSSVGGLSNSGLAADGEVEDYRTNIVSNQFSVDNPSVVEGDAGTATLTFTISRTTNSNASAVDYAVSAGTATLGTDYVSNPSGTINFPMGGALSQTVSVTVNGDLVVENNETIILTLSNPVNGGIGVSPGTGTITDDDNATLTLSGGIAQNEGNAGTTPYVFTVTLNNEVQGGFNVPYTTNDGTATVADLDYVDNDGPALVFAGTAGESHTITVLVNGDTKVEANETFTVALGTLTGTSAVQIAAITPAGSPQQGTINNDDNAIVTLTGTIAQNEGNAGTTPFTFTATLNNAVQGGFTLAYNTNDGTATVADLDYIDNDGPALVFAGTAGESHTITVLVNGDIKVEANETFTVTLGAVGATTLGASITTAGSPQTGTITNDDNATVTLTPAAILMQNEGNTGTTPFVFTATLNNPVQGGFTLPYTTDDLTATTANNDYQDNDGTLTFTGTMGEAFNITVLVNGDLVVEANEGFNVVLGTIMGAPAGVTVVGSPQMGLILNDEIDFGDAPDSYGTLLPGGARHGTSLVVHLGATVDGDLDGQPGALADGDDNDAEGDDDDGVTLPAALVINTSADITVNASINGFLNAWVDFNLNGDFNDPGDLVFNQQAVVAGNNSLSFAVPNTATLGNSYARFRFTQSAVPAVPTGSQTTGEVEDYAVEIVNTQFSINDTSVVEGNAGTVNLAFVITRTVNANDCSVDYAITGGTAQSGSDYQVFASGTATFLAGGPLTQTINVIVNGDNTVELDETVLMTLSNPVSASILDGSGVGTIFNDDAAVITITSPSIVEGDAGSANLVFTINMTNPSDANVDVNYTTVDGTATTANSDYTLTAGSHTFTPGQISKIVSVPINGDCAIELNETFIVRLSGLVNNGRDVTLNGGGATLDGTGTITNDDAVPGIICPGNITMNAAPGVCNATVTVTLPTTSSLCGASTLEFRYRTVDAMNVPTGAYTAFIPSASNSVNFQVGRYQVEWRVTDGSGSSTCAFFLEVVDNQPPVANCVPLFTLNLNGAGTGTLLPANLNNNSTDNCAITTQVVTPVNLTCANVGPIVGTLTVGDAAGLTASCNSQVDVIASAFCTPPAISNAGGPNVADPCTCLGNGRFSEEVVIGPANPGQMWRVQSTTLINPNTNLPYAPGTLFTEVPVGGNQSIYVLQGIHLDGVGYTLTANSIYFPAPLSISNTCFYPDPVITGPEGTFCVNSADATFTGTAGAGIDGTGQFFLNGAPVPTVETPVNSNNWVTTLDFSALGVGNYTLVFQFDAGNPAGLLAPPNVGCIASVSRFIAVVATPSNLVCNDLLTISLDESCSLILNADDILEGSYFCYDDYIVELDRTLPLGNGPWTPGVLGPNDVHKTYAVRVTHLVSGNNCWGNISVEDKLPPVITCPCTANEPTFGCTYDCADLNGILNGTIATPLPIAIDGCEGPITTIVTNPNAPGANLYKQDVYFPGADACSLARIERTWTAKDSWGNSAQCTQIFYLEPFTHDDIDFPDDITIDCAGCGDAPGVRPCDLPAGFNVPFAGLYPLISTPQNINVVGCGTSGGLCNLGASYTDIRIDICAGTFKILRKWTVLDWCTNTTWTHDQLIKVVDEIGPDIAVPADMTVSTNPSQCCATVDLPNVIVEDFCSPTASISAMIQVYDQYLTDQVIATYTLNRITNPNQFRLQDFIGNNYWDCDTLGNYGVTPCLPIGRHLVTYMAEDVCGNTSAETFWLTVVDDVPPVATCTEFTTVAIGPDDPTDCYEPGGDCQFAGVTWVPASAFNQGSYDNCNDIAFTVRRMTPLQCIEDLKNVPGCDNWSVGICGELNYNQNNGLNDEYDIATAENDSIKFYCCEVGTTQMIILRVYQLDINGNRAFYTDEFGNPLLDAETNCIQYIYNECMIEVEVQDKIKPNCLPPASVTVACENFEPSLWAYGYPSATDNCCLDETPPTSADPQGVTNIPAGTTAIPGVCGMTQKTYYNGFLNANFDTTCNRGVIIRRFTAWDCYGQSTSCTQRITVTNVQDYNIEFPTDKTINCVTEPVFGAPIITNDEGCELIGISYNDVYFTVVPDACYKIERTWTVINWCTYNPDLPCYDHQRATGRFVRVWAGQPAPGVPTPAGGWVNPNCVTYKQIIKVIDQTPPTVTCAPIDTCDYSTNDTRFWNDGDLWWDNGIMSHDLCESDKTLLSVSAADLCDSISPVGGLRFRYLLFLDLDNDGTMETVVSSADANTTRPNGLYGRVRYNNYQNLNYGGGQIRRFDLGGNPFAFNIEQTLTGARVTWRTAGGTVQNPNLPHGTHKIKWIAEDGCGNEAVCEEVFTIRDCKRPVVACADVNINLMFGVPPMATLWTSDFFLYAEDNCTPVDFLKVAVIRADESDGVTFPAGSPQSIVVDCDDEGTNVAVEVWVIDAAGNADFCTAYVNVQANLVGCDGTAPTATVAGALATENAQGVEDALVELALSSTSGQAVLTDQSDVTGSFQFPNAVPMSGSYTLTPTKDDNPLNGVTTYDLVLISKHILGLEPLNTPYKMIAADANRSGSVTTFDIVEFRKLILGIYDELPTNTSWRFVDKSFSFPNPSNPFQSLFPENISVQNVQADQLAEDFVGVKVGDVNGTVTPNSLVSIDDRTSATMLFDVQDRTVKAGETFTVNFKGAERVQGYQFTMNFNGLEVVDIVPGTDMKLDNFGVFGDAITTSVDGVANEFAVTFRATKAGQISNMLGISSRITKAEAYSLTNDRLDVAFRFNGAAGSVISGVGFELYQNQPNPFVNKTFIGFHLPEAANATLRIFDETGRMVFTQQGDFAKGYNSFAIDRQLITTTGVLYYTVETTTDSATKKMIQSK